MKNSAAWIFKNEVFVKLVVIVISGILAGVALNMFLIPANVFSSGLPGIAQLVSGAFDKFLGMQFETGILIFVLNIPIFLLSWLKLGKSATVYSFLAVVAMSLSTMIIPVVTVTQDTLLNSLVGGVIVGISAALCLKFGFTTGGLDIVALVIAKTTGRSVASLMFLQNLVIIAVAGLMYDWQTAIYTILSIYCLSVVVDKLHTSSQKVTAFIISSKSQEVVDKLKVNIPRGMTLLDAKGAFSNSSSTVIMTVVSRYELYDLEKYVYEIDEKAFVNIVPTQRVLGQYWNEDQQRAYLKELHS
ncbi:YitT family protein [Vagococcus coleopterorum]|uniref:YitT family protein n=1 Tax=Vagococcus coleopterorum TaxID=2714946 RepID=A0A6G8AND8_9ENTE|nr:YitT family protein [Vagococcus coleopterorum]QIL46588.1 YitT family protein [Vagococcus coleopterorum]